MQFATPLLSGRLIKRYKRFLADIRLDDGREVTAHCANPGSMMGLADEGTKVWVEPNDDPKKKLKFGWRLVEHANGHFVGVDTSIPNKALKAAFLAKQVSGFEQYDLIRPEVKYGENSRIDFLLSGHGLPDCYVEVKSVTLSRTPQRAEFPDSVTARGAKHLQELAHVAKSGNRAVMFYLVQRTDCTTVSLADDIDPNYVACFRAAEGIEAIAMDCSIDPTGIDIGKSVEFIRP